MFDNLNLNTLSSTKKDYTFFYGNKDEFEINFPYFDNTFTPDFMKRFFLDKLTGINLYLIEDEDLNLKVEKKNNSNFRFTSNIYDFTMTVKEENERITIKMIAEGKINKNDLNNVIYNKIKDLTEKSFINKFNYDPKIVLENTDMLNTKNNVIDPNELLKKTYILRTDDHLKAEEFCNNFFEANNNKTKTMYGTFKYIEDQKIFKFKLDSSILNKFKNELQIFKKIKNDSYIKNYIKINKNILKLIVNKNSTKYIKNNQKIFELNDNIMIITYNEDSNDFVNSDLLILLNYIEKKRPSLIVVGSQESIRKKSNFQNVLKNNLITNYELLIEKNAHQKALTIKNKNVTLNIYCLKDINIIDNIKNLYSKNYDELDNNDIIEAGLNRKLFVENSKITRNKKINLLKQTNNKFSNLKIINPEKLGRIASTKSGLGTYIVNLRIQEPTIYKGSIMIPIIIIKNNKVKKFIFVVSHLYFQSLNYGKKTSSGLNIRKKNFDNIVEEFKLHKRFQEGFNIFFFGDLNFRLTKLNTNITNNIQYIHELNPNKDKNKIKEYIEEIIKESKKNKEELYIKDEIYQYFQEKMNEYKNDEEKLLLYKKFKKSIEKSKTFLTFKHSHFNVKNKNGFDMNNKTGIFKLYNQPNKSYNFKNIENQKIFSLLARSKYSITKKVYKPPSNPDRIVYALKDVKVKKNDLRMFIVPCKSDHKLITLNFDLDFK